MKASIGTASTLQQTSQTLPNNKTERRVKSHHALITLTSILFARSEGYPPKTTAVILVLAWTTPGQMKHEETETRRNFVLSIVEGYPYFTWRRTGLCAYLHRGTFDNNRSAGRNAGIVWHTCGGLGGVGTKHIINLMILPLFVDRIPRHAMHEGSDVASSSAEHLGRHVRIENQDLHGIRNYLDVSSPG